eukprot:GEZU01029223.1.p1 GENE.GEZU01029223.1~~GEZU01029223.1.p1  ORF type:complete len:285 (-),score=91.47 GEZU01029223.1:37-891(-)
MTDARQIWLGGIKSIAYALMQLLKQSEQQPAQQQQDLQRRLEDFLEQELVQHIYEKGPVAVTEQERAAIGVKKLPLTLDYFGVLRRLSDLGVLKGVKMYSTNKTGTLDELSKKHFPQEADRAQRTFKNYIQQGDLVQEKLGTKALLQRVRQDNAFALVVVDYTYGLFDYKNGERHTYQLLPPSNAFPGHMILLIPPTTETEAKWREYITVYDSIKKSDGGVLLTSIEVNQLDKARIGKKKKKKASLSFQTDFEVILFAKGVKFDLLMQLVGGAPQEQAQAQQPQ